MKIAVAILILTVSVAYSQESGYGYLYQYDVEMNTDMQWNVAPEALEVGTARGGAGAWVAPLSELGNWDSMKNDYQEDFDDKIMEHAEMKELNDVEARDDIIDSDVTHVPTSMQFSNMLEYVSQMAESTKGGKDFLVPYGWTEEAAPAHLNETFCFYVHIEKLAEYMPVGMRDGLPTDAYLIDFSDGWRRTFYDIVKTCMSFLHVMAAIGFGFKCIRWALA